MPALYMGANSSLAAPPHIQSPKIAPEKAVEIGSSAWGPAPTWEAQVELLAQEPACCDHLGNEPAGRRSLFLPLSLLSLSVTLTYK